ncbi:RhoGAP group protein [Pseudozyma hubeiensis SY62]|uniref:RhoGAP group protein n=1 Tax=Pseudozyma hubeiensis (strain SY62) TaxID=1305764 RepID=R9P7Y6_PSEHS|nr:RhoGAP group protein [Pseudozyma hubeiensis SY62]GAC97476.1 RhoGAP group protein [Pseudozyma hubeiensis SY62]
MLTWDMRDVNELPMICEVLAEQSGWKHADADPSIYIGAYQSIIQSSIGPVRRSPEEPATLQSSQPYIASLLLPSAVAIHIDRFLSKIRPKSLARHSSGSGFNNQELQTSDNLAVYSVLIAGCIAVDTVLSTHCNISATTAMPASLTKATSRGNASIQSHPAGNVQHISSPAAASTSQLQPVPSWPKKAATPQEEQASTKAGLKAWWASFTKGRHNKEKKLNADRVFGVPLRQSLKYASVAISIAGEDGQQYVWGYVPVVVAKVGLYLKENATEVEGVFRIAGSQKRMKELQETFDSPPRYGKSVDWTKYSVHDAASVLRRYFNHMPEPVVPHDLYTEFRNIRAKEHFDEDGAIKTYRLLISSMPSASQYLLLYVLDLLAVFARKSDKNLMPSSNLAVIFQPGMFSHPSHELSPGEHKLAVQVLEFLIDHQDQFVLGMTPQPASQLPQDELTAVSKPITDEDILVPSDSDEEQGELQVHEGGGAVLMRSKTTKPKAKRYGFGRSRRDNEDDNVSEVDELSPQTSRVSAKSPTNDSSSADAKPATGLRRSRTTPSRKPVEGVSPARKGRRPRASAGDKRAAEEEQRRIVAALIPPPPEPKSQAMQKAASSAGHTQSKPSRPSVESGVATATSAPMRKALSATDAPAAPASIASVTSPAAVGQDTTGLPTPPASKILGTEAGAPASATNDKETS